MASKEERAAAEAEAKRQQILAEERERNRRLAEQVEREGRRDKGK